LDRTSFADWEYSKELSTTTPLPRLTTSSASREVFSHGPTILFQPNPWAQVVAA
jgi:hypothetical protein